MKRLLTIAALALLATNVAQAGNTPPKLHKLFLGEWCVANASESGIYHRVRCRQSDGWLNVRANGFSAHEMDCTLQSASPNRSGEYRAQFTCRGTGETWTAYYWIGLDAHNHRHLFLNETDATFTGEPK